MTNKPLPLQTLNWLIPACALIVSFLIDAHWSIGIAIGWLIINSAIYIPKEADVIWYLVLIIASYCGGLVFLNNPTATGVVWEDVIFLGTALFFATVLTGACGQTLQEDKYAGAFKTWGALAIAAMLCCAGFILWRYGGVSGAFILSFIPASAFFAPRLKDA